MTTRYKIAEQVLRIVNGGNTSEDSSIDIREVMLLVDQERNTLIKTEIMDWSYTKSTSTAKGELEINGAWLTQKTLVLKTNTDNLCYAEIAELDPTTNKHGLSNYISLPNDMGIHRVASSGHSHTREIKVVKVGGKIHKTNYQRDTIDIIFNNGPKVLDKNYIVSFDFTIGTTLMSNGSSTQNQYAGVKTHNISFNVDTSGYDSYENKHFNFIKALVNSPGFKKFIKDFDIKYGVTENDTNDNAIVDTVASILHVIQVRLSTSYGSEISDFKINGVGKNSIFGGPGVEYGGATITTTSLIDNNIGLGWVIYNLNESINSSEALTTAYENSHGIGFIINDTIYSSDYIAPEHEVTQINVINNFVLLNADKLAREQNLTVKVQGDELHFEEIIGKGGFSLDLITPGNAFIMKHAPHLSTPPGMSLMNYEPIIYTRMPSGGDHNSLYNRAVNKSGRKFWYTENKGSGANNGPHIYLYKQYGLDSKQPYLSVSFIATSESLSDTDPYPIPGDYEKIIIKNLVEMFSVMKKATEDMTNDNID
tara:strand:- start:56 stop:1666 length:1611 start_codon:yes stop_codon:yes gene_type:complete